MSKKRERRPTFQGGESARFMIRVPEELRAEWQADADDEAGLEGAPLGPWIRRMVERGRRKR